MRQSDACRPRVAPTSQQTAAGGAGAAGGRGDSSLAVPPAPAAQAVIIRLCATKIL